MSPPSIAVTSPEFLGIFGIGVVVANLWAAASQRRSRASFSRDTTPEISNPFDLAFLAGGARRATHLAIIRLIASGHARWISKWTGPRLARIDAPDDLARLEETERNLCVKLQPYGRKGMPGKRLIHETAPFLRPSEIRLAGLGLRPTAEEKRGAAFRAIWPLLILLAVGTAHAIHGAAHGNPGGFLMIGIGVTGATAFAWGTSGGRLTPAGKALLTELRETHRAHQRLRYERPDQHLDEIALAVGLFGLSAVANVEGFGKLHRDIAKHTGGGGGDGFSVSGCSSGCGSGCGGGCGGCGD